MNESRKLSEGSRLNGLETGAIEPRTGLTGPAARVHANWGHLSAERGEFLSRGESPTLIPGHGGIGTLAIDADVLVSKVNCDNLDALSRGHRPTNDLVSSQKNFSYRSTFPTWRTLSMWHQQTIRLPAARRGFHLITGEITRAVPELASVHVGWIQVFIQHTSASLTINENADPDVRVDFETAMNHAVPETLPYVHTLEGPDDMPAHVKASMMGSSVMIPIGDGRLQLGTWQGIYLCEHRDRASGRSLVITIHGEAST